MSLSGKVILITGASRGIGRAIAERVAAEGASVVVNYNSSSKAADEVVSKIGADRALAVQADASKISEIEKLVDAAVAKFGKIDVVIPNAAIQDMLDLAHVTEADYDRHFNLNVKGALFLVQRAVPHMPAPSGSGGGGRVIFLSTGVCTFSLVSPGYLLYAATKGAVDQMVRVLAKDLAPRGITVNAVAPGPTATDMFLAPKTEQQLDALRKQNPFGRFGEPDEIASVVAFVAGEGSKWVSGQTIRVNGAHMV
ncbi:uncharacterized protein B0T15DRAFT_506557 [Chaetomium strumarium]|uniref:Ketoreductase domain-containing protein n=1 Tax=Chaetomium strumarium TaxID=1170767 RepID=A0AAJ0H0Y6_9PEZI|nr:hypothetical protein B0T15DRAFT_506557 [Chaetomium strumarium]